MIADITVNREISSSLGEVGRTLLAPQAVWATIEWPQVIDDNDEEYIQPDVIQAVSEALASCGTVAFRHPGPVSGTLEFHPEPKSSVLDRIASIYKLEHSWSCGVAVATDASVVSKLFEYPGWYWGMQRVLVFDPNIEPAPIIKALNGFTDWNTHPLPTGVRLFLGSADTPNLAVLGASKELWLNRFTSALP
ncbi:hypothetical protein ACELLULO517_24110 [Acidisoma cellulosilytica]|uniref:Uncharacterized protein n=1 Tax=Acidisoma cellulosilyticum TaxID=2802395 RepID=A0A963Z757_9PROT|nr:hypothetical protein [Acidisoma cellulosilyticum]MCB8883355.1 hypothetical protein [Acidisoma cellulosilyticum]